MGRNSVVKKTIEIDRALAPISSVLNSSFQHSYTLRALGETAVSINGTDQASRYRTFKRWFDLLWDLPGGKADQFDPTKLLQVAPEGIAPAGMPNRAPDVKPN